MADQKQDKRKIKRRDDDRRSTEDPAYTGPDRRKGDRRQHERRTP